MCGLQNWGLLLNSGNYNSDLDNQEAILTVNHRPLRFI